MSMQFGFSLGEELLPLLPESLPESLIYLEIDGTLLDQADTGRKLEKVCRSKALTIRDIMPGTLAEAAAEAPLQVQIDFDRSFRKRCRTAAAMGAKAITLNCNILRAVSDPEYGTLLKKMLLSLAGTLEENRILLLLPLPLPNENCNREMFLKLLDYQHKLFYPGIKYLAEFYFDENNAFETLADYLDVFCFDHNFLRLSCEPEPGMFLTADTLKKIRSFETPNSLSWYITLAPGYAAIAPETFRRIDRLISEAVPDGESSR